MTSRLNDGQRLRAVRIAGWINRWVPGVRTVLVQIDRIAVAYLERRYVIVGRREGSTDSTTERGA